MIKDSGSSSACCICGDQENLIDTRSKNLRFIHKKLKEFVDSKDHCRSWVKFICSPCRTQLNDAWEFQVFCKTSYREFLNSAAQKSMSCVALDMLPNEASQIDCSANEDEGEQQEIVSKVEIGEEGMHYEDVEMLQLPEEKIETEPTERPNEEKPQVGRQSRCKEDESPDDSEEVGRTLPPRKEKIPKKNFPRKKSSGRRSQKLQCKKQGKGSVSGENRRLACSFCKKEFKWLSALIVHERIHTGERQFVCEFCSIGFCDKGQLNRHMNLHKKNRKEYKCKDCNKRYTTKGNLNYHRRIHTGEKPYKCNKCQQKFYNLKMCQYHVKRNCPQMAQAGSSKEE